MFPVFILYVQQWHGEVVNWKGRELFNEETDDVEKIW